MSHLVAKANTKLATHLTLRRRLLLLASLFFAWLKYATYVINVLQVDIMGNENSFTSRCVMDMFHVFAIIWWKGVTVKGSYCRRTCILAFFRFAWGIRKWNYYDMIIWCMWKTDSFACLNKEWVTLPIKALKNICMHSRFLYNF